MRVPRPIRFRMNATAETQPQACTTTSLHRATVCLWADSIEEKVEFSAWERNWRRKMSFVSHDYGCGCCIHLFDLEGPKEAIDALPQDLLTVSAWTENGLRQTPRHSLSTTSSARGPA